MPINARLYVEASESDPPAFGLFSAANIIPDSDPHWQLGVDFQPEQCWDANATTDRCTVDEVDSFVKEPSTTGRPTFGATPVTLYTWLDCSPVGSWDDYERLTRDMLDNSAERRLEQVIYDGDTSTVNIHYPHLVADTAVIDTDTDSVVFLQQATGIPVTGTLSAAQAIGVLEGAMAECYTGTPVIHVPRNALAILDRYNLVERRGSSLYTLGGSRVAVGSGYGSSAPDGTVETYPLTWFYATSAIDIRVSDTKFTSTKPEALRRDVNSMVYIAERTYTVLWGCCQRAVQVDLSQ